MKAKHIIRVFISVFLLFTPILVLSSFDLAIDGEYKDFYYAELSNMYNRLKTTKGKKIVIIGNSNVSFGVESRLFEELISDFESSYSVVNFGLYGAIGTKAMLDLAQNYITEGDIVILAPEEYNQSMSLYFSADEMWYALDSNRSMFNDLDSTAKETLLANYNEYVAKKYDSRKNNRSAHDLGIYSVNSFDSHCDMVYGSRYYNIMMDDYDINNLIDLTKVTIDDSFINYLNSYNEKVINKKATMYYSFSPMNKLSIVNTESEINAFYNTLRLKLNFRIISNIHDYIMDKEWFYDSNFHLNYSGMKLRTYMLVNDLKNELGITTKTNFKMLEKPVKPDSKIEGEGDNTDKDCFTYELDGAYYKITGLTDKGLSKTYLIIPYQVDGIYVSSFAKEVFNYKTDIKTIVIQENIKRIYDNSFLGTTRLEKIYLLHDNPTSISVGFNLLIGTNANIYVKNEAYLSFINDYFWGLYQERINSYEED